MSYKTQRRKQKLLIAQQREIRAAERAANIQKKYKKPKFTPLKPRASRFVETDEMRRVRELPSLEQKPLTREQRLTHLNDHVTVAVPDGFDEWTDEQVAAWAAREMEAWKEIERKKKCVAPIANKMGYQYVADLPAEQVKTLGRKT